MTIAKATTSPTSDSTQFQFRTDRGSMASIQTNKALRSTRYHHRVTIKKISLISVEDAASVRPLLPVGMSFPRPRTLIESMPRRNYFLYV